MNRKQILTRTIMAALTFGVVAAPFPVFPSAICSAAEQANQSTDRSVVLVGDLQQLGGASSKWSPSDTATRMHDDGNGFYSYTIKNMPAGTYNYKIAINGSCH